MLWPPTVSSLSRRLRCSEPIIGRHGPGQLADHRAQVHEDLDAGVLGARQRRRDDLVAGRAR